MFDKIDQAVMRLADAVYEQLFEAIVAGKVRPGERLIQEDLAEQLAVSRTPVREALLRLERERVVELVGRRGFVVRDFSEQEIRDIYQAREAIEGFAAGLVAERADQALVDGLEKAIREQDDGRPDTVTVSYLANREVHRTFLEAAGNGFLTELFDSIWTRSVGLRLYADLYSPSTYSLKRLVETHLPLLEPLRDRDPEGARGAMVLHIARGCEKQVAARRRRTAETSSAAGA
jgi:GntR family transcriptional regulator, vanillate catabolism transcriptional regulator